MLRIISRALLLAIAGALASAASLALAVRSHPEIALDMDRELPGVVSGLYPGERDGRQTFAWARGTLELRLPGLDRRIPWMCTLRFRGGRPPQFAQPVVTIAADGGSLASRTATNEYADVEAIVPAQPADGLTLTVSSSPTFVPGPSDRRELGIQVDRLACTPSSGSALPARRALAAAALAGAVAGAASAFVTAPLWITLIGIAGLSLLQAIPLSTGPAPYTSYAGIAPWLAGWIVLACAAGAFLATRGGRRPLHAAAACALALSGGALYLELLALLHPSKLVIDALFHAHRLEWVLSGRYFFTQPMPSGVRFPYAIALYVVAAPWTWLTENYIALLKVVVCVSRALAGLALYPLVVRAWGDRSAGLLAIVLYHLAPLPFLVIGNANLTYAFGQSMMALTLAAAATWTLGPGSPWQAAGLFALASIAFLSHVGIFPIALAMLVAMAALYWLAGGSPLRSPARRVLAATILATVFSVVSYYGHFGESYKTLAATRAAARSQAPQTATPAAAAQQVAVMSVGARLARAAELAEESFGWPVLLLAAVGVWRVWAHGMRDRLGLLLGASALAYVAFVGFSVVAPVDPRFQRYNEEFISRINHAALPMLVVVAARGATWMWRAGLAARLVAAAVLVAAAAEGLGAWRSWLQ